MQPDPSVFLYGVRRELIRLGRNGGRPDDRAFVGSLERSAEALLQIAFRTERLPRILTDALPDQCALLADATDLARAVGIRPTHSLGTAPDPDDRNMTADARIERYDALLAAQSNVLHELSREGSKSHAREVSRIASRGCFLERTVREAIRVEIATMRDQQDGVIVGFAEADPTPEEITSYLQVRFPDVEGLQAVEVRRQKGVNTKEIFFISIEDRQHRWPSEAVLRRNRIVDSVGNVVSDEFELLQFLHDAGLPVPRPLAADGPTDLLRRPFLLTDRLPGRTETIQDLGSATKEVFAEMARFLAKLHALPLTSLKGRPVYGVEVKGRTLAMLDRFYDHWHANLYQPSLTLEAAFAWLRGNVDRLSEGRALIHGDFNLRNILINGGHISGVLDWELAHQGHPAEDLGYCQPQVEEVMAWTDFTAIYREAGGPVIDEFDVRYFQIYGLTFGVSSIYPACNGYLKSRHDDILIGATGFVEYPIHIATLEGLLQAEYAREESLQRVDNR